MKPAIVFLFVSFFTIHALVAQHDKEAIQQTINRLFDGMREGDSAMVHAVMAKDIVMQRVTQSEEGATFVQTSDPQRFLNAIGTPHEKVWDERIAFGPILIDGDLASAWTPYKFYLGDKFSHCGVNSFRLYRSDTGWKIFHLVDTSRKENCID